MTHKELDALAKKSCPNTEDAFFHYSDKDIWQEGFRIGYQKAVLDCMDHLQNIIDVEEVFSDHHKEDRVELANQLLTYLKIEE